MLLISTLATIVVAVSAFTPAPTPTPRQLEWMQGSSDVFGGLSQFMHYGIPTYWVEGDKLNPNGTYHDCKTTLPCTEESCGDFAPCLKPDLFQPDDLNPDQWMETAVASGMQEICLTAQHEGGFALWPSKFTNYSVASSSWMNGKGDVLRQFVDAAKRHNVGICYYLNVQCNHYFVDVLNLSADEYLEREMGMLTEVLENYGPVNRIWFDGTKGYPKDLDRTELWNRTITTIREKSPYTLIASYRDFGGDIGSSWETAYRYASGPAANSTSLARFGAAEDSGPVFAPTEQVGVCMQEGPSGDENIHPTYWFWHPEVGYASPQRLWHDYLNTTGHGVVLMINIPAGRNGSIPDGMVNTLTTFGDAVRNTFTTPLAINKNVATSCADPIILDVSKAGAFDFVMTKEDMTQGQRVGNYSVDYRTSTTGDWKVLVPPVTQETPPLRSEPARLGDRPAGTDQRDPHIGVRRIDVPVVSSEETAAAVEIRFNCIRSIPDDIYIREFAVYKADLPWEK